MFVAAALMIAGVVGVARSTAPASEMDGSFSVDITALQSDAKNLPVSTIEKPGLIGVVF
jgi:hypothetical protein